MRIKTDPDEWSSWNDLETLRKMESSIKELYPNPDDITTLSVFDEGNFVERNRSSDSVCEVPMSDDEEVDVLSLGKISLIFIISFHNRQAFDRDLT